jgi:hypothetical protein
MFNIISKITKAFIGIEVAGLATSFAYGVYEDYKKESDTYASANNVKAFLEYQAPFFHEDNLKKIWNAVEYIAPQFQRCANILGQSGKEVMEYGIGLYTRAIDYNSTKVSEYYTLES